MQAWYVAEFNTCIVVRANTIQEALAKGEKHPLLWCKKIRVIRHATADEISLHERETERYATHFRT